MFGIIVRNPNVCFYILHFVIVSNNIIHFINSYTIIITHYRAPQCTPNLWFRKYFLYSRSFWQILRLDTIISICSEGAGTVELSCTYKTTYLWKASSEPVTNLVNTGHEGRNTQSIPADLVAMGTANSLTGSGHKNSNLWREQCILTIRWNKQATTT